jgi:acyl-CoA synthetase (AMP-forming)/AMP-acid ligase II
MRLVEPGTGQVQAWGAEVVVEDVLGFPCKVHAERPRHPRTLLELGARHGDRAHLVQGLKRLSFADLVEAVERVAARLRAGGARSGDHVMLSGTNSLACVATCWACLCNGWVLIPANAWWSPEEIEHAVRLLDVRLVVADRRRREAIPASLTALTILELEPVLDGSAFDGSAPGGARVGREQPPRSEDDPAMVLFTSVRGRGRRGGAAASGARRGGRRRGAAPGCGRGRVGLAAFAAERLAYFAVPTAWWFVSELPRNAAGKVVKKRVADRWPDRTLLSS